jgi:hypothetical protein
VVSPEGKVLASRGSQPRKGSWESDTLRMLDEGLDAFGEVAPREARRVDPLPLRGRGGKDDGAVVLAVYVRPMLLGFDRRGLGRVVPDSVPLTKEQKERFSIANAEEDATFTVPSQVVRQLHRILGPSSDPSSLVRADEVTRARLTGRVERVRRGIAYLSFKGYLAGVHVYEFNEHKGKKIRSDALLRGVGTADAKTGKLLSLTLVGDGRYRHFPPHDNETKYGAVVEWRAER